MYGFIFDNVTLCNINTYTQRHRHIDTHSTHKFAILPSFKHSVAGILNPLGKKKSKFLNMAHEQAGLFLISEPFFLYTLCSTSLNIFYFPEFTLLCFTPSLCHAGCLTWYTALHFPGLH